MVMGDESDSEEEEEETEEEEEDELDPDYLRTAKFPGVFKEDKPKVKIDVPKYGANLKDELLDWIAKLDDYFESKDVPKEKKVKIAKTKLKGHALLWWDYEQSERRKRGKSKISSWDRMVARIKSNFLPSNYVIQMFKKLHGLKQKEMYVKAYTEEFYKLSIRVGHMEDEVEKVARYLSGLRINI